MLVAKRVTQNDVCVQWFHFLTDLLFPEFSEQYKTPLERYQEILNYQII
jgi:hypothetical protein